MFTYPEMKQIVLDAACGQMVSVQVLAGRMATGRIVLERHHRGVLERVPETNQLPVQYRSYRIMEVSDAGVQFGLDNVCDFDFDFVDELIRIVLRPT